MVKIEKPLDSHFTDKQWQAVCDDGTNLLISASAGSGKTTVLVERVIQKIKAGVSVDELLIVTYTEAAAKEMKQRIQSAVQVAINDDALSVEARQHFVRQLSLLPTAAISTLHAFCLTVIRKYYYLIDIDPVFRLLTDETESLLLKEDTWNDLREKLYGERQEAFYRLAENFSNDRNDNGLTNLIFSLQLFALANPSPEAWLDSLSDIYHVENKKLAELELYQDYVKPEILAELYQGIDSLTVQLSIIEGEVDFKKTISVILSDLEQLSRLMELLETDELEDFYQQASTLKFARIAGPKKSDSSEEMLEIYEQVKGVRGGVKEKISKIIKKHFSLSPQDTVVLMAQAYPLVTEMVAVTKAFINAFREEKKKRNVVDFNDLEHFTLNILRQLSENNEWQESAASTYYREKFAEVLVDEYQDINRLQESILYWLRQPKLNEGNLFMVGDVKQSIYAFRLADPTLFIEKYEQYATENDGRRIILAENFRSRSTVLDFTNLVFKQLMDPSLGQIAYDKSAELVTGFKDYPKSEAYQTEILIYESQREETEEGVFDENIEFTIDDKTEGELLLIGKKIQELIKKPFQLYDKKSKTTRDLKYSDIVLLTPTKKNNLVILDVFKKLEIPLLINDTQNYFQATEIRIMVALLQVIDNPYQDIPLVSVLRSPVVGLAENELVRIREIAPNAYFYDALLHFLAKETQNDSLYQKLEWFLVQLNNWREMARREKLATLIWKIYDQTDLLDYVSGMPSGKQRQANLHALYERAEAYEEMSFKGLFQFVRLIEKMQAKDKDLAEPASHVEEEAVRVMTIHASKGLEFPVVFVLDLAKQFNLQDVRSNKYIFDEKLGAGIKYLEEETRVVYETLPFSVIGEQKKRKLLAEEMRKLYVAFTRAEQKLYLVGSYKNKEAAFKKWQNNLTTQEIIVPIATKLSHQSLMSWIGMTLVRVPSIQEAYPEIEVSSVTALADLEVPIGLSFYNDEQLTEMMHLSVEQKGEKAPLVIDLKPNVAKLKEVTDLLNFDYPFEWATKTTSYQSVSEIKRVFEDPDAQKLQWLDLTKVNETTGFRYVEQEFKKPKFVQEQDEVSRAEIGTATHLLMQLLSFDTAITQTSLTELLEDLISRGLITKKVGQQVSIANLLSFFASDFGQKMLNYQATLQREQPFSLLLYAHQLFKDYPEKSRDQLLVHGIIDGYFETKEGLVLYDFKTDYVKNPQDKKEIEKIKQRYQGQMNLYRLALEEASQRRVVESNLILLNPGCVIKMEELF